MGKPLSKFQWDQLTYLSRVLPSYLKSIQDAPIKLHEFVYNCQTNELEISAVKAVEYQPLMYLIKQYHDDVDDVFSIMIKLGDPFKTDNPSNTIRYNNKTGKFEYLCYEYVDPVQAIWRWVTKIHEDLKSEPIDDFDIRYASSEDSDYMFNLFTNYFVNA